MHKPYRTVLSNGLRVLLLESHAAPVVSINLWANVGSANETDEEAGLCHLIEHMLFKGTGRRPVGEIARQVEAAGGDMNAYTSFDETVFYINMSSRKLDVGLDILADAAIDPTFDEEELRREKEVVVEEISRSEDNPSQMTSQDLFSRAYAVHPYRRPIAGNRETVRGVSRKHLLEFYRRWYVGPNLILIVVGDFDKDVLLPRIETLYSGIPQGKIPAQVIPAEPLQTEPRFTTRSMNINGRYLDLAYPIPNMVHEDTPGLDILSHLLGGGPSSRLEQIVKEKKGLVTAINSYAYTPRHPGLLVIGAILKDRDMRRTLPAILDEIAKLKAVPPMTVEFSRIREGIRSARIFEKQTVESLARKLAFLEGIAGDLNYEENYYRQLSELTPEDIQGLAMKYLPSDRITLSLSHPQGEQWSKKDLRAWLAPSPSKKPATTRRTAASPDAIHRFRLSNGLRVFVRENHQLPLVALRAVSLAGLRAETRANNGINHLTSLLLTKGTQHRNAREIAEMTESLSGHIDGFAGKNLLGLQASFLSEKIVEGLDLFLDLLRNPAFSEEEIAIEKGHTLTAIRNEEDSLVHLTMKNFLSTLYPRHPYGFSTLGTAATVRSLRRRDLEKFHQRVVHPGNLVLSVVGDVVADDLRVRFEEKLSSWKAKTGRTPAPALPEAPQKPLSITKLKDKHQAHIVYGFLGTHLRHPDRYPLEVMNNVLAGQGGRLFLELRDKQGLAYAISSSTQEGIEPGYVSVYMGTDPVKLDTALAGIQSELEKIRADLVTEEELDRAKRFIIGNYELDLQKNESIASLLAFYAIYGNAPEEAFRLPERIQAVTRQDILRVARKYLRPEASVLSVIKPA